MTNPPGRAVGARIPAGRGPDRRAVLALGAACLAAPRAWAADPDPDETAFALVDGVTGRLIDGHRADEPRRPASLAKLATAAAALDLLSPGWRFQTNVWRGSAVRPTLVLTGDDPALDPAGLAALIDGVPPIEGPVDLLVDPGPGPVLDRIEPDQPIAAPYNPGLAGLALSFNRARVVWRAGAAPHALLPGDGLDLPAESLAFEAASDARPAWSWRWSGERELWTVPPTGSGATDIPIGRPADAFAAAAALVMARRGFSVAARLVRPAPSDLTLIARRDSPDLEAILRGCLRHSTNLTAEMVGLAAATRALGRAPPTLASAASATLDHLARRHRAIDWRGASLVNHSGLTTASRLSPLSLARLLVAAPGLADLLSPPADGSGIALRVKTGTLAYVRGLAGVFETATGERRAFAILAAADGPRRALDRIRPAALEVPPNSRLWLAGAKAREASLLRTWGAQGVRAPGSGGGP